MDKVFLYKKKTAIRSIFFTVFFLFLLDDVLHSATYYSRQSGNWTANSTWSTISCGGSAAAGTPGTADDVVICGGHTVTFDASAATTVANFTVQAGATLDYSSNKALNVNSLVLDGTISGSGGPKDLTIGNVASCTLSGSGTFNTSSNVDMKILNDISILSGSDIKFTGAGKFKLNNNSATNNGKIEIIEPSNFGGNGTFINNSSTSYLFYSSQSNFPGITLTASATGNTVEYGSTSGSYNMDNTGIYYNLIISGNGTKNLNKATTTVTNFTVTGNLDGNANNLDVTGNTLVNGRIINTTNANTITLSGAGATVDGSGSIDIDGKLIFSADHTILSSANLIRGNGDTYINSGVTVTNNGIITIDGTLTGATASSAWVNASNSTLKSGNITSVLTLNASASGNTVEFYQAAAQNVYTPLSSTFHHLTISGGSGIIKTMLANLVVNGNLYISSGTLDASASNYNITMAGGNWSNSDVFTPRSATVTFSGTSSQTITNSSGETFYNLTVNKPSGTLTLANNVTVSNTLNMTVGNIDAGSSNKITLGTSTSNIGTLSYTAGQIIGRMERWINATGSIIFPVGTASYNRKAVTNFTTLTTQGSWIIQFVASAPGNNGLALRDAGQLISDSVRNAYTEGYWDFAAGSTAVAGTYSLTLDATNFTSLSAPTKSHIISRASSSAAYDHPPKGTFVSSATNTRKRSALNVITYHFAIGDTTPCVGPITPTITGSSSVCANQTNSLYYLLLASPLSTYNWSITPASAGTITYNGGDSVKITWGSTGQTAVLQVSETNSCMTGAPKTLTVTIAPLPPGSVSGKINVAENTFGEIYNVTRVSGYTYNWAITGGTLSNNSSPRDTATVNWGNATIGSVCVSATNGCGTSASTCISVNVYRTINSVQSGDWDNAGTWDCNCNPENVALPSRNVRIMAGHTVKLKSNYNLGNNAATNHFIINSAGVLNENNKDMRIDGDFTLNGKDTSYTSSTKTFYLNGANNTIDGKGTYKSASLLYITGGDKAILSGTDIVKSSSSATKINASNITVTNNGEITLAGDLQGINSTNATWLNAANSYLRVAGSLIAVPCNLLATGSGNTVEYNAAGAQTIYNTTYYHLTLSSSGVKTVPDAVLTANGNITISGAAQLDASITNNALNVRNILIAGTWSNTSTNADPFVERTGSVTFNGATTQTITAVAGENFNDLTINNTSGGITLNSPITVNAALTLTNGIVTSTSSNVLTLTSSASATSGTSTSFVSGPIIKQGTSDFIFPVGKGTTWARIGIAALSASTNFRAEYFNTAYPSLSPVSSPLDHVSGYEYWQLDRISGSGNAKVSLYWEGAAAHGIDDCPNLTVGHWDSGLSTWDDKGSVTVTGSCAGSSTGNIQTNNVVTTFSPFTFATSSSSTNSLPIELIAFNATVTPDKKVDLTWSTATETNNNYFTVERSTDGINFENVTYVKGAGNSTTTLNYKTTDPEPLSGISYYRLKQTDYNGNYKYSTQVAVEIVAQSTFKVYPSPSSGEQLFMNFTNEIKGKEILVVVNDIFGNELYSKVLVTDMAGNNVIALDPSLKLAKGVYVIVAGAANVVYKQKLVIE